MSSWQTGEVSVFIVVGAGDPGADRGRAEAPGGCPGTSGLLKAEEGPGGCDSSRERECLPHKRSLYQKAIE